MIGRRKNWLAEGRVFLLLELALVAALGAVLAHWTWVALTPRALAAPTLSSSAQPRVALPAVRPGLFGAGQGAAAEAAASAKLKLVGVVAPDAAGSGRAIFVLESGRSKSAGIGETIAPGFVVHEVHPDHVVLGHSGGLERVKLERRARR